MDHTNAPKLQRLRAALLGALLGIGVLCGCAGRADSGSTVAVSAFDPETGPYLRQETAADTAQDGSAPENTDGSLSVPTILKRIGDTWFLADCYHNRVLYTPAGEEAYPTLPIWQWSVLPTDGAVQPHTMAGDGEVLLVDDTESNRVLVCTQQEGVWTHSGTFTDIGNRPHFSVYDSATDTFYVWSSESGQLYCFRHPTEDPSVYLTQVRTCAELQDTYVRSFTLLGDRILFVSGISSAGATPKILLCRLSDLSVLESWDVADAYAGMVQILPVTDTAADTETSAGTEASASPLHTRENFGTAAEAGEDGWFVTISTDRSGSQDAATMLRIDSLEDLSPTATATPEDIYTRYFTGGGTPYYMTLVDGRYFLMEHRLPGHSVWSFAVQDGEITDVVAVY